MKLRIILLTACCHTQMLHATNLVKLHGKITHPLCDSISVLYSESWVGYERKTVTAKLAGDGTFSLSFPQKYDYTVVAIQHGDQGTEIAPLPGDNLDLTVDASNFDSSLQYTGRGADVANFVAAHMIERSFVAKFISRMHGAAAFEPDSFSSRIHTSITKEEDFVRRKGGGLPESFKSRWLSNFTFAMYNGMLDYPFFHEMQKQQSYSISKFDVADFGPVMEVPVIFSDDLLEYPEYRNYITKYYAEQLNAADRKNGIQPHDYDSAALSLSIAHMPERTAEFYEASFIYSKLKYYSYAKLETLMDAFTHRYPKSEYRQLLIGKIAMRKKTAAGSPEVDFAIHTADGKSVNLSDLKGKVVFLDFWATWCGPCMAEMPHAKEIERRYAGKDVVFVYVSIDGDDATWRKSMDKLQIEGLHMRDGNGGWNGPVVTAYDIHSVPSYFLIDKQGIYVTDAAPRPSDTEQLTAAIDRLLQ